MSSTGGCSPASWMQAWRREICDVNSRVNEDLYQLVTRAICNTHLSFSIWKLPRSWRPFQESSRRSRRSRSRRPDDLRHRLSKSCQRPRSRVPSRSLSKRRTTPTATPPRTVTEVEAPHNETKSKEPNKKIPRVELKEVTTPGTSSSTAPKKTNDNKSKEDETCKPSGLSTKSGTSNVNSTTKKKNFKRPLTSSSSDELSSEEDNTKSSKQIALEIEKAKEESKKLDKMLAKAKKAEAKAEAKKSKNSKGTKKQAKLHKTPSMVPSSRDSSTSRSRTPTGVKTPSYTLEINAPRKGL